MPITSWTREGVTTTSDGGPLTLSKLTVDDIVANGTNIGHTDDLDLLALSSGTLTVNGNITGSGTLTFNGNATGLTELQVDNINLNLNTINATSGDLTITAAGGDISFGDDNLSTTGYITVGTGIRKESAYVTCAGAAPSIALAPNSTSNDEGGQINWYGVNNSGGSDWSNYSHYIDTYQSKFRMISVTPGGTISGGQYVWRTVPDTTDITNPAYEHFDVRGLGALGTVRVNSSILYDTGCVSGRTKATIVIASGVGNIVKNTAGSFCQFTSESSTSDDLDFVNINGAAPAEGTELIVRPTNTHTITVRTGEHASVTSGAGGFQGTKSDGTTIKSYVLSSATHTLNCFYNGARWIVLGGNYASITT